MSVSMIAGHSPYSRAGNLHPPKVALQETPIRFQVNPVTAMTCWCSLAISPRPRGSNPSGSEFIAWSTMWRPRFSGTPRTRKALDVAPGGLPPDCGTTLNEWPIAGLPKSLHRLSGRSQSGTAH